MPLAPRDAIFIQASVMKTHKNFRKMERFGPYQEFVIASTHRDAFTTYHLLNGWSIRFCRSENFLVPHPNSTNSFMR